jgi:hypothetical protein
MGLLTATILATTPWAAALAPTLMAAVAFVALAAGVMVLLARFNGDTAGQFATLPALDMVLARVSIASHEPSLRSMTGRGAAAPSRAPPSHSHLVRLTVHSCFNVLALPLRSDRGPIV